MEFTNEKKIKIWRRYFGNETYAIDVFGRRISINNFDADHIYPQRLGGSSYIENGIPLHSESNEEKANYLEGVINHRNFKVKNVFNNIGELWVDEKKVSI